MHPDAERWIKKLALKPHPEGGYFSESYRSDGRIPASALPSDFAGECRWSTAIYFLLEGNDFSAFHRIRSDEVWHFYAGSEIVLHWFSIEGLHGKTLLGADLKKESLPQWVIPAGTWFAAEVLDKHSFALVGCTVAPGFEFSDFELARRERLIQVFPQHAKLIEALTRSL